MDRRLREHRRLQVTKRLLGCISTRFDCPGWRQPGYRHQPRTPFHDRAGQPSSGRSQAARRLQKTYDNDIVAAEFGIRPATPAQEGDNRYCKHLDEDDGYSSHDDPSIWKTDSTQFDLSISLFYDRPRQKSGLLEERTRDRFPPFSRVRHLRYCKSINGITCRRLLTTLDAAPISRSLEKRIRC